MSELSVFTVDDEPLALLRLEQLLHRIPNVAYAGSAESCAAALRDIARHKPDVLLLDVSMRDGTAFDILEKMSKADARAVIFVTAFDHFAVRAFERSVVDYVLKPVSAARLQAAIERARERIASEEAVDQLAELQTIVKTLRREIGESRTSDNSAIWIRGNTGGVVRLFWDDVEWIASEEDYVRLHTRGASYLVRHSIQSLLSNINAHQFVRVHRAALVRKSAIKAVHRKAPGKLEVELYGGARITAGRVYGKALRAELRSENSMALRTLRDPPHAK